MEGVGEDGRPECVETLQGLAECCLGGVEAGEVFFDRSNDPLLFLRRSNGKLVRSQLIARDRTESAPCGLGQRGCGLSDALPKACNPRTFLQSGIVPRDLGRWRSRRAQHWWARRVLGRRSRSIPSEQISWAPWSISESRGIDRRTQLCPGRMASRRRDRYSCYPGETARG